MSRTSTVAGGLEAPFAARLRSPERLLAAPGARFVKDHRRTAVAAVAVGDRTVYVKRFKPYAWYRPIEWLFTGSPARRCWQISSELERHAFPVAPPLAFTERFRLGLPLDSYLVTAAVAGSEPAARFWRERAARLGPRSRGRLVERAAAELRRFHDAGFYSRDANADNFLIRWSESGELGFWLLDLENVRRLASVSQRKRIKNLVQLHGPVRDVVRRLDRARFVRAYLGGRERLREWLRRLEALDARKEAEYRRRREQARRR